MTIKNTFFTISVLAVFFAVIDQFSKWGAVTYLQYPVQILSWIKFEYHQNIGMAWGVVLPYLLLLTINFIMLIAVPWLAYRSLDLHQGISKLAISLALGGALGNIIDRFFRGYVIDFIVLGPWPVFNLADTYLCMSVFLILAFYAKIKRN